MHGRSKDLFGGMRGIGCPISMRRYAWSYYGSPFMRRIAMDLRGRSTWHLIERAFAVPPALDYNFEPSITISLETLACCRAVQVQGFPCPSIVPLLYSPLIILITCEALSPSLLSCTYRCGAVGCCSGRLLSRGDPDAAAPAVCTGWFLSQRRHLGTRTPGRWQLDMEGRIQKRLIGFRRFAMLPT